jgi:hypothetical protein
VIAAGDRSGNAVNLGSIVGSWIPERGDELLDLQNGEDCPLAGVKFGDELLTCAIRLPLWSVAAEEEITGTADNALSRDGIDRKFVRARSGSRSGLASGVGSASGGDGGGIPSARCISLSPVFAWTILLFLALFSHLSVLVLNGIVLQSGRPLICYNLLNGSRVFAAIPLDDVSIPSEEWLPDGLPEGGNIYAFVFTTPDGRMAGLPSDRVGALTLKGLAMEMRNWLPPFPRIFRSEICGKFTESRMTQSSTCSRPRKTAPENVIKKSLINFKSVV